MKKYYRMIAIAFMTVALAACSGGKKEGEDNIDSLPSSEPDPVMIPKEDDSFDDYTVAEENIEVDENDEVIVPVSEPIDVDYGDAGYEFSLTADESALYEQFKQNLDLSIFEDVSPFSIAKIYIQAGIDSEWEVEWAMFAPETIGDIEKNNFRKGSEFQRKMYTRESRQGSANWFFGLIDDGAFMKIGNEGYLQFYQVQDLEDEYATTLKMLQDDNGIWRIVYNPIEY